MANPIVKIKREINKFPTTLTSAELGVDLGINKLYIGNSVGVSIPISAEISDDVNLSGVNANHNRIPTQKAAKTYIQNNINPSPPPGDAPARDTFFARFTGRGVVSNATTMELFELYGDPVIQQSPNMGIQIEDPNAPLNTGFLQTSKSQMTLQVNYNLTISSVDSNVITQEGSNLPVHRMIGMRVINKSAPTNVSYYGMQTFLPAIASDITPVSGLPTLVNGSAVVNLPRYIYGVQEWELQLVYRFRSFDLSLGISDLTNGVNDPILTNGYAMRVQMVKLAEVT